MWLTHSKESRYGVRSGLAMSLIAFRNRRRSLLIVSGALFACALLTSGSYKAPNVHRVQPGETFASIARRYSTGYERLTLANPTIQPEKLRPGAVIVIPGRIKQTLAQVEPEPGKYKVQNGDTDWSIARRHGIKPSDLRQANPGVNWTALQIGQFLSVPGLQVASATQEKPALQTASLPATQGTIQHKAQDDDNDWTIARRYGVTPPQVRAANPNVNWNRLRPGTMVNVPKVAGRQTPKILTKRAKVVRDNVIVRAGASTEARKVTMVDQGRFAKVRDRIGDWYKLAFSGGTVGWVRQDLLTEVPASQVAAAEREERLARAAMSRNYVAADTSSQRPSTARNSVASSSSQRRTVAAQPRRQSSGKPDYSDALAYSGNGDVIDTAASAMGVRYRWGGTSRSGFDCSGFTTYVYSKHGVQLPRTSIAQSQSGKAVSRENLSKGDLVFFNTRGSRVSHVGIYVGNGKFIHASSGGGRVRVNSLNEGYYARRYTGARRPTSRSGTSAASRPAPAREESKREATAQPKAPAVKPNQSPVRERVEDPNPGPVNGTDAVGG